MAGELESAIEITLGGIVQGVGFRPFVYRLARRMGLCGHVCNLGDRVIIRVAGSPAVLDAFAAALLAEAPPLARIDQVSRAPAPRPDEMDFRIIASGPGTVSVGVVPDVATCPACRAEMADPKARRFRYAFTNCTDCGPRFSIVTGLPYDRPATTMAGFIMCPDCAAEYADPADRRFHAQPIACPVCGPRVWLERGEGPGSPSAPDGGEAVAPDSASGAARVVQGGAGHMEEAGSSIAAFAAGRAAEEERAADGPLRPPLRALDGGLARTADPARSGPAAGFDSSSTPASVGAGTGLPSGAGEEVLRKGPASAEVDPLAQAAALLCDGGIVAVKGIGGFHIACDATNAAAVDELRRRKRRPAKPLAIMADGAMAARLCIIGTEEAAALAAPSAPIVLLPLREGAGLAAGIAPGQRHVGVMLPYTPLHHLLLEAVGRPLVMTSGNSSGAPQVIGNGEARAALAGIVDAFLMHDRPIARRLDDSVMRLAAGQARVLRRGRGLAPMPLALPEDFAPAPPILALGAELKSAICLTHGAKALLSHHLGDLDEPGTADAFDAAIADYGALFAHAPQVVAVDAHPGYHATRLGTARALADGLPLEIVQHHHAHMAAVMAENGWRRGDGPVIGIVLDGLGLGADGTIWGAEILCGDYVAAERVAHLSPIPLMGGDAANREPWRVLLAHLDRALGRAAVDADASLRPLFAHRPVATLRAMADKGLNAPPASSAGRLFDAVAALLGLAPTRLTHEGEAAMALEACARLEGEPYPFALTQENGAGGVQELDPSPLWRALVADRAAGRDTGAMAGAFHLGLGTAFADAAALRAEEKGVRAVALSGGVFQNALLMEIVTRRLADHGLRVLLPAAVPANDGGLALGQAAVAAARQLARE
ncbi:carbamoyltransferase HypF [Xanthobacter variabilis]|uniref:carbamoyltransferase HypF n=1 Tax=Xanthobacter variabilis TaxID=3119932 RepID=UPI00374F520A